MIDGRMRLALPAIALLALGACADSTAPGSGQRVSVAFAAATSLTASQQVMQQSSTADVMQAVSGTNGTLTITEIGFVIAELELEAHDGACDGIDKDGCPDFEAKPQFVQLPVSGGGDFDVTTTLMPPGSYQELRFEVEALEADQDDDQERRNQIAELLTAVRASYSDFPAAASMVVVGNFNGTPFRVYFDAEFVVDMDLDPALSVSGSGADRALTVRLAPDRWFLMADGSVRDLSQFDYATTGQVLAFSLEIDRGFVAVDID